MNSTVLPILTTQRLTLRQLSIDDQQNIFALRSDPAINKYLDRQPAKTTEDAVIFINKVNENIEKRIALYWAVTLKATNTFVGTIGLFDLSSEKNSCEIGYELMTRFQRHGIMKEAAQMVIEYAFYSLKLENIHAFTHCENQASTKLLEKLNFKRSSETYQENPELHHFILKK